MELELFYYTLMTIEEIVNIFSDKYNKHYVLQKQIISNNVIKAFKEYRWVLWEIKPKKEVFIINITSSNPEKVEKELNRELIYKLIDLYEPSKT